MYGSRRSRRWLGAALVATLAGVGLAAAVAPNGSPPPPAEISGSSGMCHGRSDPDVVMTASDAGADAISRAGYELEIVTDGNGDPSGLLVAGSGADQLRVDRWCRLWMSGSSGQTNGELDASQQEATTVHVVGVGELGDGTLVLVRTDVKSNDEGISYRIRYREMADDPAVGSSVAGTRDRVANDDHWTRIPEDEWAPLTQFAIRST